ncbi:MAG: hypothetical protein GTN39_03020 [Candidatus Aenigmarchaeota archaeon]|nr:hypothetical protein [Candidatus Aenigmarchaeota archaeon]
MAGSLNYGLLLLELLTPSVEGYVPDAHVIQKYDNPKPIELRVDAQEQACTTSSSYNTKDEKIFANLSEMFRILENSKTERGKRKKFGDKFKYFEGSGNSADPLMGASYWTFEDDMQLDDDKQMEELLITMSGDTLYIEFVDPESGKLMGYMAGGVKTDEKTGEFPTTYYVSLRGMDVEKARDLSTRALKHLKK